MVCKFLVAFCCYLSTCTIFGKDSFGSRHLKIQDVPQETHQLWPWKLLFSQYVQERQPIIFRQAVETSKNAWSFESIYFNPAAALTFRNLTSTKRVSLRKILQLREFISKISIPLPRFLRQHVSVPSVLRYRNVLERIGTPTWLWHFTDEQIKLHNEPVPQFWCILQSSLQMTLLPKWSDGMIDHFANEHILMNADGFRDAGFYNFQLNAGDCILIPDGFLRQWTAEKDYMALIYEIAKSATEVDADIKPATDLQLDTVKFVDETEDDINQYELLMNMATLYSFLGPDEKVCYGLENMEKNFEDGSGIGYEFPFNLFPEEAVKTHLSNMFSYEDTDKDGKICWQDLDALQEEDALSVAMKIKEYTGKLIRKHFSKPADEL